MDRLLGKFIVCCIMLSLTGCINAHFVRQQQKGGTAAWNNQPRQLKDAHVIFAYPHHPIKIQQTSYKDQYYQHYQTNFIRFKSVGYNGQEHNDVSAIYYRSKLPGRHKLLVVMPIWGGANYPPDAITQYVLAASKGNMNVIRLLGKRPVINVEKLQDASTKKAFYHELKLFAIRTENTIIDIQRLIAWVAKQQQVNPKHIGLVGFSKGAIIASLVAQADPQVTSAVYVLGGSDPAAILSYCDYYQVRDKITKRFHWSNKKLQTELRRYTDKFNVFYYKSRLNPSQILILDSHYDKCIPRKAIDDLWLSSGKPKRITFFYGHQYSFVAMTALGGYRIQKLIYDFVKTH